MPTVRECGQRGCIRLNANQKDKPQKAYAHRGEANKKKTAGTLSKGSNDVHPSSLLKKCEALLHIRKRETERELQALLYAKSPTSRELYTQKITLSNPILNTSYTFHTLQLK